MITAACATGGAAAGACALTVLGTGAAIVGAGAAAVSAATGVYNAMPERPAPKKSEEPRASQEVTFERGLVRTTWRLAPVTYRLT